MADRVYAAGEIVGQRFRLTEQLGKGAFGAVWKAQDGDSGQMVAIKLLLERYRRDKKVLGRFAQEGKLLERLEHPNIAKPVAWNVAGDDAFLAMEYIDGETLDQRFEINSRDKVPVPLEGVAWICEQLAQAVGFAHANSVVHRDLKPRNVMVNRRGTRPFLKVLDFGIAKVLVGSEIDPTTVGRVLGSILYISPEQVMAKGIDHRSDIFSLGTIMYELLTLRRAWARDENGEPHPFHIPIAPSEFNSHVAVLKRIAREPRPKPSRVRAELPPAVDEVIAKAMAIDPDDRYETVESFAIAFRSAIVDPYAGASRSDEIATLTELDARVPPSLEDSFGESSTRTGPLALPELSRTPALGVEPVRAPKMEPTTTFSGAPPTPAFSPEPTPVSGAMVTPVEETPRRWGRVGLGMLGVALLVAVVAYLALSR